MKRFAILFFLPLILFAQAVPNPPRQRVTPEEIQAQLTEAEAQYEHALELFNPWYTGPLITPSATMVPPGYGMVQPYLYFTDRYGVFDEDRNWVNAPNRFTIQVQPVILQVGVTKSVDATISLSALGRWQQGKFSGGYQDMGLAMGFMIQEQGLYVPKAKFTVSQSLPTGKYKNLNPDDLGLDATGAGAWQTTFTLAFGKLLFWNTLHPFNTRLALQYSIPTPIKVTNFNAYGGGYGTKGTVHPGQGFSADLGLEVSINQPWVVALDVVYNCTNRTTFSGYPGRVAQSSTSALASVTSGFSDQLSLAPAVEYNFNENMGMLWGAWFTVYGRNASNFVSGIFSWYWMFP